MKTHRRLFPALLTLALAAPLLAQGEEHIVALVRAVRAAPGNTLIAALLGGLADMPAVDMQGGQLRAALREAGLPSNPVSDQFLGPIARLKKDAGKQRFSFTYPAPAKVEVVMGGKSKGWVTLERDVAFRCRRVDAQLVLDDIKGIKLSQTRDSFSVSLKKIVVLEENGRLVAKATAGLVWPLEATRTIDLSDPSKIADEASAPESGGINGALR